MSWVRCPRVKTIPHSCGLFWRLVVALWVLPAASASRVVRLWMEPWDGSFHYMTFTLGGSTAHARSRSSRLRGAARERALLCAVALVCCEFVPECAVRARCESGRGSVRFSHSFSPLKYNKHQPATRRFTQHTHTRTHSHTAHSRRSPPLPTYTRSTPYITASGQDASLSRLPALARTSLLLNPNFYSIQIR